MPEICKHIESPLGSYLVGGAYLILTRINCLLRIYLLFAVLHSNFGVLSSNLQALILFSLDSEASMAVIFSRTIFTSFTTFAADIFPNIFCLSTHAAAMRKMLDGSDTPVCPESLALTATTHRSCIARRVHCILVIIYMLLNETILFSLRNNVVQA